MRINKPDKSPKQNRGNKQTLLWNTRIVIFISCKWNKQNQEGSRTLLSYMKLKQVLFKMALLLYYYFSFRLFTWHKRWNNRFGGCIHIVTKFKYLFGYFTGFVNSVFLTAVSIRVFAPSQITLVQAWFFWMIEHQNTIIWVFL